MSLGPESTVQKKKRLKLLPCVREIVNVSKAEMYPASAGARTWADANQPRMSRILGFSFYHLPKGHCKKKTKFKLSLGFN